MVVLVRNARITDPRSPLSGKTTDLLIDGGVIAEMKKGIRASGAKVIEHPNLYVSPGWFDMQANFRDPGMEYKEDLHSGCRAAEAGGFTGVCLMPSTDPPVHSKADIEYIRTKSEREMVEVYPAGAVSVGLEGKDLSEMYDMYRSGAICFTDDKKAIANAGLLIRALQYAQNFGGLVMTFCDDRQVSLDGKVNEGIAGASLGMKSMPSLAEEIMVARNIFLAEYCNSRIHLQSVSSERSVDLIREAKRKRIKVTASVNSHHLLLDDSMLAGFDSNLKVNPPLRTRRDIEALKRGIADGTIDAIVSDHSPEDVENKVIEFDLAAFGMSSLETSFSAVNMSRGRISFERLVEKMAINPRKILGLPVPLVKKGEKANLTLFDPSAKWIPGAEKMRSKSKNNPLIGKELTGKVIGIINKGKIQLNGY